MAAAFGMTRQAFHDVIRPLVPATAVDGAGERGTLIRCRAAIDAYADRKVATALAGRPTTDPDPLLAGAATPALEDYRRHRARLAELDVAEREGRLVDVAEMTEAFANFAGVIRGVGQALQRQYGPEAAQMLNDGLDDAASSVERFLAERRAVAAVATEATKPAARVAGRAEPDCQPRM